MTGKFANHIDVDFDSQGGFTFTIDGEPFPYEVGGVTLADLAPNSVPELIVRIPANRIAVVHSVGKDQA